MRTPTAKGLAVILIPLSYSSAKVSRALCPMAKMA